MSESLVDLDFENTTDAPTISPQTMPLTGEALIAYSSPGSARKKKGASTKTGDNNGDSGNLFDDLGMDDPSKRDDTATPTEIKLNSSQDMIIDFSSPPMGKK
eukprot:gene5933-6872_t